MADLIDKHLFMGLIHRHLIKPIQSLSNFLHSWMTTNCPSLNASKTQLIRFGIPPPNSNLKTGIVFPTLLLFLNCSIHDLSVSLDIAPFLLKVIALIVFRIFIKVSEICPAFCLVFCFCHVGSGSKCIRILITTIPFPLVFPRFVFHLCNRF